MSAQQEQEQYHHQLLQQHISHENETPLLSASELHYTETFKRTQGFTPAQLSAFFRVIRKIHRCHDHKVVQIRLAQHRVVRLRIRNVEKVVYIC